MDTKSPEMEAGGAFANKSEHALVSIAASLKRIADALYFNKDDGAVSIYDLLNVIADK